MEYPGGTIHPVGPLSSQDPRRVVQKGSEGSKRAPKGVPKGVPLGRPSGGLQASILHIWPSGPEQVLRPTAQDGPNVSDLDHFGDFETLGSIDRPGSRARTLWIRTLGDPKMGHFGTPPDPVLWGPEPLSPITHVWMARTPPEVLQNGSQNGSFWTLRPIDRPPNT